jgi:hypothetical protein
MKIEIKNRILREDTTTADEKGAVATMIGGTSARLHYASNGTAQPVVFRPQFSIGFETKRPAVVSSRRRRSKPPKKVARPDLEMMAFATPAERPQETLAFELLSTSLVPRKFPEQELRSKSPYARRG